MRNYEEGDWVRVQHEFWGDRVFRVLSSKCLPRLEYEQYDKLELIVARNKLTKTLIVTDCDGIERFSGLKKEASFCFVKKDPNIVAILNKEDTVNFDIGARATVKVMIVGMQPRWGRFLCRVSGEQDNHNLSTIFEKYGKDKIIGVKTKAEEWHRFL